MAFIKVISTGAIPFVIFLIIVFGVIKGVKVYDTFLEGAKEGISVTIKILPVMIGIMVAIGVFKSSGALDMLTNLAAPIVKLIGIPKEIVPLALLRPISGSASLGLLTQQLKEYGPDSYIGKTLSTMLGSTETIFYVLAVYFGAVGIKKTRYAVPIALVAQAAGVAAAVWICKFF